MTTEHTQVAIVGGGPVGLGLAVELGGRGVAVTVLEKHESLHHIPKGQNLTQRTMEHFRSWGIEHDIRAARVMPQGYPASGVNAYGNLMSDYAHSWFRRSEVGQYYFAANERLPQYLTEAVLRERVARLPSVTTRYGAEVTALEQHEDGAQVLIGEEILSADYVVGCDGSRSLVREQAGIAEERSDHDRRMVLLVFRSRELHEVLETRFGRVSIFNVLHPDLDGYWRFLGRVDVGEGWFFHAPVAPDATTDTLDYRALLWATVGSEFALDLDYIGFWDLRIAIADTYRNGRIFIAGDAAHSHPPYGGYGINTGFEDARNLGWKLAAVLDGWGGSELLDSYTAERRPVFISTARDFIEAFIENDRAFIAEHDPGTDRTAFAAAWNQRRSGSNRAVLDFEPHYEGSPIVYGPQGGVSGAIGSHSFAIRAGHHLPPRPLTSGNDLFDALGSDFTVIAAAGADVQWRDFAAAAHRHGIPLTLVSDSFDDAGPPQPPLVVVRPDLFVAWVDDGAPYDAATVLRRVVGAASG